jgi:hypothetical protein
MNVIKRIIFPVFTAAIWISISEFLRNQVFFKNYWIDHYGELGLVFPAEPANGAIWGVWSILFATLIYFIAKKFTLLQTTFLCWFAGFVLMWTVIGNLGVLPFGLLIFAVPLRVFETFMAAWIIKRLSAKVENNLSNN